MYIKEVCQLCKGGTANSLKGRENLQKGVAREMAITNCMKFNNSKCQIFNLGQNNSGYT